MSFRLFNNQKIQSRLACLKLFPDHFDLKEKVQNIEMT